MSDATAGDGRTMHDRAAELLEGYVLDALDPPETAVVDEHLDDGCEDCEEELGILRRVVQALPLGSRLIAPSEGLRDQILDAAVAVKAVQADAPSAQLQRRLHPFAGRAESGCSARSRSTVTPSPSANP